MPDHDAAMVRRLVENLIVPEAHWTIEQLRRCDYKSGMPQQIVQAGSYAPGAECMEEYPIGVD
jgi:hypothetical protein